MKDESAAVNPEPPPVPWTGAEIFASVFLAWFFWPGSVFLLLRGIGFEHWYYGDDTPATEKRMELWALAFALPFQLLTFPFVFAALSRTRPEQLGLTAHRLGRNALVGLLATLALAPPVYGIYYLLQRLYSQWGGGVEKHPLEDLAVLHLFTGEWVLLTMIATVGAPLLEELTFRGVLQPWLAARRWRSHAAMLGALLLTVWYRREQLLQAWPQGIGPFAAEAAPLWFVLTLEPIFLLVSWRSRAPAAPAIFATSLLFACVHVSVWPTPVPLFVLGLGLGVLAARTRSLVGPIVLHSLFNGISCVQLMFVR